MHRRRAIERLFADGLAPRAVARLRGHLARCEACRCYYDEQLLLARTLRGAPLSPTGEEDDRAVARALAAAGVPVPKELGSRLSLFDTLLWAPAPLVAGLAALALVGLIAWRQLAGPPPHLRVAGVVTATGLSLAGVTAEEGAEVRDGTLVRVAPGGLAELALDRGGRVRVFSGGALTLGPEGTSVDLQAGKLWCQIDRTGTGFRVVTDTGEVRVVGTSFVVDRRPDGITDVKVMSGAVEVEDAKHRGVVRVGARQRTRLSARDAPTAPTPYSPEEDQNDWDRLLSELGRRIRGGLNELRDALDGLGKSLVRP